LCGEQKLWIQKEMALGSTRDNKRLITLFKRRTVICSLDFFSEYIILQTELPIKKTGCLDAFGVIGRFVTIVKQKINFARLKDRRVCIVD
jgi:hypothetical protein